MPRAVAITVGKKSKICPTETVVFATNCQLSEALNRTLISESLLGRLLRLSSGCGRIACGNPLGMGGAEGVAVGTEGNEGVDETFSELEGVFGVVGKAVLSKSEEIEDKNMKLELVVTELVLVAVRVKAVVGAVLAETVWLVVVVLL